MTALTLTLPARAAFATGLAALAWVAWGASGTSALALAMTLVMAAFYVAGALELFRFQRASLALDAATAAPPADAAAYERWLAALPAPLPGAVRLRVDHGGRGALPGPALAPTITGLLVLLGMLGTFLGMVSTLHGTGLALEHAIGVDALRDALSAPVKGLGLAFGTSVAGVATSAMLGLMTALARRERAAATQGLDRLIATALAPYSAAHRATLQHEETLRAMQRQADAVPVMVTTLVDTVVAPLMDRLQSTMAEQQRRHDLSQQRLLDGEQRSQQRLLDAQTEFHARTEASLGALSAAVERSLKDSLADGARHAHAQLQPLIESALAGLARESAALQGRSTETAQRQIADVTARLSDHAGAQAAHWAQALDAHRRLQQDQAERLQRVLDAFARTFEERADAAIRAQADRLADLQASRQAAWATQDAQRLDAWRDTVSAMTADLRDTATTMATGLRDAWQVAGDHATARQQQICDTLAETAQAITQTTQAQARATVDEIARLMRSAAEAPRAAAEVIAELRERLTDAMARDDASLRERERLMATLGTLLDALTRAGTEQRDAIETLVSTASRLLLQAGERLQSQAEDQGVALTDAATRVQAGAVEMAALGETFGFAVQRYGESNEALMGQLQRIEAALSQSLARSDDQLNYYVAQAREVIDLSLSSQKQVIEDLQALAGREAA